MAKILTALLLSLLSQGLSANTINTFEIVSKSIAAFPSCSEYKPVGVCFWLACDWSGCGVEESAKVEHYLPDVVVSVYPERGHNVWQDPVVSSMDDIQNQMGDQLFKIANPLARGISIETGNTDTPNNHEGDLKLREVDVIGNPALVNFAQTDWLLKSQARPYVPYYHSGGDAALWRSGEIEQLAYPAAAFLPGSAEIGNWPLYTWGAIYPRTGFVGNPDNAKASAVVAVKAGNIISSDTILKGFQTHLAINLNGLACPNKDCTTAGTVDDKNSRNKWQRLMPDGETTCTASIRGDYNVASLSEPSWIVDNHEKDSSYVWLLWRQYRGCLPHSGIFLYSLDFGQ